MSRAPPPSTNGIQEYYTPRPTLYSSATSRRSMPRVEQQHTHRHVQLSDIQKPKEPRSEKKAARPSGRSEQDSFWSWLSGFLDEVKTKASTQVSTDVPRAQKDTPRRSHLRQAISNPDLTNPRHSAASSKDFRIREAQQAAREDQLEYEAQHYSLWGELVYIYKSLRVKVAKKKVEAARQKHREARQKTHEEKAKIQVALVPDIGLPEEQMAPVRYPTPSPNLPLPPRLSQQIKEIAPESHLEITRKPVQAFSKTEGEVRKHAVKITHLPPVHNSVHLQPTPPKSPDVRKALEIDHKRKSSHITTFGDFMRKPSEPSERLARLPPHIPTPVAPRESQRTMAEPFRQRNGTQWTFTVPGIDEVSSTPILPNADFPKKINEERESRVTVNPQECILCGTLNSPKTHYNQQGLWLCTACRSPMFAKEVPPAPAVPRETTSGRYQSRSGSSSRTRTLTTKQKKNESTVFNPESFSEPEPMRASMIPSPLYSLRTRRPRSSSVDSPVSPLLPDPFANFDTKINSTPRRQTPLSPDFQVILAQNSNYRHSMDDDESPPTPPLKDGNPYWPPKVPSPAIIDAPLLSSKSFRPPKPQSAWSESTIRDSARLSYYHSTPTTPKALPQTPKSPLVPQRPRTPRAQIPEAPRKRTTPKPKPSVSQPRTEIKESTTTELPPPPGIPSDFPFLPPPIPTDDAVTLHKPKRSSSIYPEDEERYTLPPFEFSTRFKSGSGRERRDTSFYDFWKGILEERGGVSGGDAIPCDEA
ncbi:hypothetical protein JMJ35_000776 [Cladonia borealis]|uniref:Uncharacterized protein n=1 Tax=Cladonia borealis TaxID=184061 RepID=A0AA39RA62_9LECA|nr:hypothetical protein JMJ35_000776 [Cladonia borealis]